MFHVLAIVLLTRTGQVAELEFWCGTGSEVFICSMLQQMNDAEVLHLDVERAVDA